MGLETANYISQLQPDWPLGATDSATFGDNHLRLIKSVLKTTFPGALGDGFAEPILSTEEELNSLQGIVGNVEDRLGALEDSVDAVEVRLDAAEATLIELDGRLDTAEATIATHTSQISALNTAVNNASFPTGTVLPFYNATPPPGWTLVTAPTTRMLVVGGGIAGGAIGGAHSPILNDKVPSHTHTVSGTTDADGAHNHGLSIDQLVVADVTGDGNIYGGTGFVQVDTITVDAAPNHTHTITGLSAASNVGAINWEPTYYGLILCSKN